MNYDSISPGDVSLAVRQKLNEATLAFDGVNDDLLSVLDRKTHTGYTKSLKYDKSICSTIERSFSITDQMDGKMINVLSLFPISVTLPPNLVIGFSCTIYASAPSISILKGTNEILCSHGLDIATDKGLNQIQMLCLENNLIFISVM